MEFNRSSGNFHLSQDDITLLGEPKFAEIEPLSAATSIYKRAESRAALNQERALEARRPGIDRNELLGDITSTNIRLAGVMGITALHVPDLVSPAHDVEMHLSQWQQQYNDGNK